VSFILEVPAHLQEFKQKGFVMGEGRAIRFCDPVSGERVEHGEVPSSLWNDEVFCEGIATLARLNEKNIPLRIAFNYHRGEQDIDPLQHEAPWLEDCTVVGLEWNSEQGFAKPARRDEIRFEMIQNPTEGLGQYIDLSKRWLDGKGVVTVPSDIDTPTTINPEDDTLRMRLNELLRMAGSASEQVSLGRKDAVTPQDWERHHIAWGAYHFMRQYLMLSTIGYMAARFEDRLQPGDTIGLVLGSGHLIGVPQKAQQLGLSVEISVVHPLEDNPLSNEMYKKAMPDGVISLDALGRLAEYSRM
jgi:hypothetical protein